MGTRAQMNAQIFDIATYQLGGNRGIGEAQLLKDMSAVFVKDDATLRLVLVQVQSRD